MTVLKNNIYPLLSFLGDPFLARSLDILHRPFKRIYWS